MNKEKVLKGNLDKTLTINNCLLSNKNVTKFLVNFQTN